MLARVTGAKRRPDPMLAGAVVEVVGLRPALVIGAACYLFATASPFVFRAWHEMDEIPAGSATKGR